MLVIQNIKIKFQKSAHPVKIKTIRVGYNQQYSTNQKKYHQISTHLFQWIQSITLSLYYNVPLQFTCTTDHNYDNPEDPNSLLSSKVKIIDYKQSTSQGVLVNKTNQKVATISIAFKILNQRLIIPEDKGRVFISSILAHFENHYGSKAMMEISIGYKSLFTPTVSLIAGEFLWSEQMAIPLEETYSKGIKEEIILKIIIDEKNVGVVKFPVQTIKSMRVKYKKFKIVSTESEENIIGTLFLDIVYRDRIQKQSEKPSQNSISIKKTSQYINKQSSHRLLKDPSALSFKKDNSQKQSSRSERMLPQLGTGQPSQALLNINLQLEKRKKNKRRDDLFQGVFNLGSHEQSQNIRQILKERRKKKGTNASLPKLK